MHEHAVFSEANVCDGVEGYLVPFPRIAGGQNDSLPPLMATWGIIRKDRLQLAD